jgi:SAM-dependent methyltransferase
MALAPLLGGEQVVSNRKRLIQQQSDKLAEKRDKWINKNRYFYNNDHSYMQFLVSEGARVLELGCGTGQLLNGLNQLTAVECLLVRQNRLEKYFHYTFPPSIVNNCSKRHLKTQLTDCLVEDFAVSNT